jgi:hypothetical protein
VSPAEDHSEFPATARGGPTRCEEHTNIRRETYAAPPKDQRLDTKVDKMPTVPAPLGRHSVMIELRRHIPFRYLPRGFSNATNGEIPPEGFWTVRPDQVLESSFHSLDDMLRCNIGLRGQHELAAVLFMKPVSDQSNSVRFEDGG